MNPGDFDGDGEGISFSELPPSVRQRVAQAQAQSAEALAPNPAYSQFPRPTPEQRSPTPLNATGSPLAPIGLAGQQGEIYQQAPAGNGAPPAAAAPTDNSPWLFIGATAILGALGWWAYSKMEKDKKFRVGPPQLGKGKYGDDDDSGPDDDRSRYDDEESDGPLDAYEDMGLDPKEVDPHEKGGIKLVRG
jgi:hypothetical protein